MLIALFCLFFGAGVYIAAVLGVLALILGFTFSDRPFWLYIGQMLWNPSSNFLLVAIPLFLLMGEIMLRAGLSEKLYRSLNVFLASDARRAPAHEHPRRAACSRRCPARASRPRRPWVRSRCRTFAVPATARAGCSGSLAAGGALGNLIPPGITFILYGLLTDTSVGKLYLAALGPSLLVLALFIAVILWHGLRTGTGRARAGTGEPRLRARDRRSGADDGADRARARHDLRGTRHADRVGGVRRRRRRGVRR